jgi:outer membrane protein OmpA-like peptidoglycan-associated protein
MNRKYLYTFVFTLITLFPVLLSSQEMVLVVERCKMLSQTSPIHNIWADEENIKWVANKEGLHKVLAIDLVQKVSIPSGTTSLLTIRGGNAKIEWNTSEMASLLGNAVISSASYDPKSKSLWIGTQEQGAFQVSVSPLKVIQRFNVDNKRLTSNQINDIFIQPNGTTWIATNDGMLVGSGDKWTLEERYLNFVGVDAWGQNMWILGDDFLWQIDSKGKWLPIAIELKNIEGKLRDIAVDDEGRVWIASNMMTGYDVEANRYQRFGPGQYFTSQYVNCLDVDQDGSIWTGTDDKGLYLIQWEAAMTINILMDTPLDCKSTQPTAALSVKVSGGEPPFTYKWNTGQTTDKVSQLAAGNYVLSVTDSKGLMKSAKYEIPDPSISLKQEIIKPSSGSPEGDASVNLLVNGGSGIFKYAWDNGESQQMAVKLTSGTHAVTVTDENGCSATIAFSVPEKITPLSVTLITGAEIKCAGTADGIIQADVKGGKAPVKYKWSTGSEAEGKLGSLAPGNYSVTIADAAGQTASALISLVAPAPLEVSSVMTGQASVSMSNGQAQVKASGGVAPYTYTWSNGESAVMVKNLPAGTQSVTVTDANGCSAVSPVVISENIATLGVIIKQTGQINCHGQATAALRPDIAGGKAPYTYIWSDGQTSATAENLKAGEYKVTVTDVVGSKFIATSMVTQPDPVNVTMTVDAAASTNASDGKATARASGGSGAYQFIWDNGEKTAKALKLLAGNHTVTVTDAAGCSSTGTVSISENILALQVSIEQTGNVLCAGSEEGRIQATVKGGKEPYVYKWSNGGSSPALQNLGDGLYTLTITDAAGQSATSVITVDSPQPLKIEMKAELAASTNMKDGRASAAVTGGTGKYSYAWDNGEKEIKATALGAGTHTVTVTDQNGCKITGTVSIFENILPLATSIKEVDKILCAGQATASLEAVVTGGKSPYTITWRGPEKTFSGDKINQLPAGQYALQVMDANGSSATTTYEVKQPEPLKLIANEVIPANTGNADGQVILKATGGTGGYTLEGHTWTTGAGTHKIDELKPGNHLFRIKDASGCAAEVAVTITEDILPLTVSIEQTNKILCPGTSVAGLTTKVKGGKGPYTYLWNNASTSSSITDLPAGKYSVIINDVSGQKAQVEYTVSAPPALVVELVNLRSATNDRLKDGKGSVEVKGGTGPYTYLWSSGETTVQASKLPLGPGTIVVTDANGCVSSAEFIIREKVLPELTADRLSSGEPIRMEKIQFDADSIVIKPEAVPSLDELYEFSGHTNSLPADDYCDRISSERAKSVADYLVNKGIEARRVISIGHGKRKPIAPNQTAEGRKRNQRVEIRLIKIEE